MNNFVFKYFKVKDFTLHLNYLKVKQILLWVIFLLTIYSYRFGYFAKISFYKEYQPFSSTIFCSFILIIITSLAISHVNNLNVKLFTGVIIFISLIQFITPHYIAFIQSKSNYYVLENGLSCKLIRKYNNKVICKIEKDLFLKESVRILDLTKNEYQIEYSKKKEYQFISVEEFCKFTGLNIEQVQPLFIG
ncbi:MAG: hypothetical protein H7196_02710 [candidate division SR1 bacterium]|nr:hypothetical protein [candidate division SR1 bacterium]